MDSTNSTTTQIVSTSSAGSLTTTIPLTSSSISSAPDPGPLLSTLTTSTLTLVTVVSSIPTSTLTTTVPIDGSSPVHLPLSRSSSLVAPLTQQTTATLLPEIVSNSATSSTSSGSSGSISSPNKSQSQPIIPAFVIIGLVVASIIAGSIFVFRRRRRRRPVEHVFNRPDSPSSFVDTDPFVCASQNPIPVVQLAHDEDQRRPIFDANMAVNWWDSGRNGAVLYKSHQHQPISPDDESGVSLYSQRSVSGHYLAATYHNFLSERDATAGGERDSLQSDAIQESLDEAPTPLPIAYSFPPRRPPRSPRRRSAGLDSLSVSSSTASLLHK